MWRFFALFVALTLVLVWLTQVRAEGFADQALSPADIPDPRVIFKQLRTMLDKFENAELMDHVMDIRDMDPGQLARLNLGVQN
jgi:hypothetical protein